jgi:hypothetical protein
MVEGLPEHLAERARTLRGGERGGGQAVIYWMRFALRGHDNPALDAARQLAANRGLPLQVVQVVHAADRFASDRFHRFVLEGARDVAAELAALNIAFACHVERQGHDQPVLALLAERAAVVVTEDMPTPDARAELTLLGETVPLVVVDTACTLPMRLAGGPPDRAFRFRQATARARAERIAAGWPQAAPSTSVADPALLPFEPVDLVGEPDDVVAAAPVDHTVGPVADTPGGSRAGYARWADFRDRRLGRYGKERNDATRRDAVSRLSPYLHYGMVSPLRIAREAQATGGEGAAKFLDELLVWREMAHVWCFHAAEIETLDALPDWARATLDAHRDDAREEVFDRETLGRGRTGDLLWDAAQISLLVHGELHNNLRMTWGKALVPWAASPEGALAHLVDLNHRYALDGRDPNSYGGLLWCLGLFDRPFPPGEPVTGTLRGRSTAAHAKRLDVARYVRSVERSNVERPPRVAVIGAGMAGLVCARTLADHRFPVVIFEKSRGLGGRLATRRTGTDAFDHGAPGFTAGDHRFQRYVDAWNERGLVRPWRPTSGGGPWWVAVPGMSALGRALGAELDRRQPCRVAGVERDGDGWRLFDEEGTDHGRFDAVVVATPAPQAVPLLAAVPAFAEAAGRALMAPCWTALVAFDAPVALDDLVCPSGGPLAMLARDGAKPGRDGRECWVVHTASDWSCRHLEDDSESVVEAVLDAFAAVAGDDLPGLRCAQAHRWRYAHVETPVGEPCLFDRDGMIAACGDWCLGRGVEAAFLSGAAAAGRILNAAVSRKRASSEISHEHERLTV